MDASIEAWRPFVNDPSIPHRVLVDAMAATEEPWGGLELSQRAKAIGFCAPAIHHMRMTGPPHEEAGAYLSALDGLSAAVAALKDRVRFGGRQRVEAVREAGERLLEVSQVLRDRDPVLYYRLGGLVRPHDLIDALPTESPVAILDLFVGPTETIVNLLTRGARDVELTTIQTPSFTMEHALGLIEKWASAGMAHHLGPRQTETLLEISAGLHDTLFCGPAELLNERRLSQVVLIPDLVTRCLPLHFAGICTEKVQDVLEALNMPDRPTEARFLCEAFPVEYAPCLQAVAASQHLKQPRSVSHVVAVADPDTNAPGQRCVAQWLDGRLPDQVRCTCHVGKHATLDALSDGLETASIALVAAHGKFESADPLSSRIKLHDSHWTVADMLSGPAFPQAPVFILSACEVGARMPGDELGASGLPGALISGGASSVLACQWPAIDVAMGYLTERFVVHLAHPGFRPAAALFRAIYDLRRLTKDEIVDRCYQITDAMEEADDPGYSDREFVRVEALMDQILADPSDHPFDNPQVWGGLITVGSGWHYPSGGAVAGPEALMSLVLEVYGRIEQARDLLQRGEFREARAILEEVVPKLDGIHRVRVMDELAWAIWKSRLPGTDDSAAYEALSLLREAEVSALGDEDEQALRDIQATRTRIEQERGERNV